MDACTAKPNVLMICTDHWSDIFTRPAGHPVVMTPTLDQLARSGTRFTRAYSGCPSCIPARKSLMTGMTARAHGDRVYTDGVEWPQVPTLAQCFRDAEYQSYCVGKLHVWPPRDRLGFDDVLLEDQGRHQHRNIPDGVADDYELFLQDQGYAGLEFAGGMSTNDWMARPWHLPEYTHPINWAAREMCRVIRRRDPRKPGFWYLSFSAPHPPMTPLQQYLDLYDDAQIDMPVVGDWARKFENLPLHMQQRTWPTGLHTAPRHEVRLARKAYYATLTQIDHQIRVVLGTLREAGLIDNTIIVFTSDHGHMVGDHNMWAMTPFYELSAHIPMIIVPAKGDHRLAPGTRDDRFVEFGDIMPTLLDLAGIDIPDHVNQQSMVADTRRDYLYGEHGEGYAAQRMIRRGRYKLVYAAAGNMIQLFDIESDPRETHDLAGDPSMACELNELLDLMVANSYGNDGEWIKDGEVVGLPYKDFVPGDIRHLQGQRGLRYL
jgi:arylsulfatase A-like enzyme